MKAALKVPEDSSRAKLEMPDAPRDGDGQRKAGSKGTQEVAKKLHLGSAQIFRRWRKIVVAFVPFGRPHWSPLLLGAIAAVFVVAFRLAVPWPLKELADSWLSAESQGAALLPLSLRMGALLLACVLGLGVADFFQRLHVARFAIGTVHGIRTAALARVQSQPQLRSLGTGNLIARLVGDSARLKVGLKGILVHVATNGLLLITGSALLLWNDLALGLTFTTAALMIAAITLRGAMRTYALSAKFRRKEGKLADIIHKARQNPSSTSFEPASRRSGGFEAEATRVQGLVTVGAHGIFGLAVLISLLISSARSDAGNLLVFTIYALILRAPVVQLTRQGTRAGKVLACGGRLERLLRTSVPAAPLLPLRSALQLLAVQVKRSKAHKPRLRLGPITLDIPAGQHVAVIGCAGSGKTALLEAILGNCGIKGGEILWDDVCLTAAPVRTDEQMAYLPHHPAWPHAFRVDDRARRKHVAQILTLFRVLGLSRHLRKGLRTPMRAEGLSFKERKAFAIARCLFSDASILLLDEPTDGLGPRRSKELIAKILSLKEGVTVIVTQDPSKPVTDFDRVIELREGKVVSDGPPRSSRQSGTCNGAGAGNETSNGNGNGNGSRTRTLEAARQAVILAAGQGQRLSGVANGTPKCLMRVGELTLLEHQLRSLQEIGIESVYIVVGYAEKMVRSLVDGRCHLVTNPDFERTNSLYSLWLTRTWVRGPFVLLNGDVIAHPDVFRRLVRVHGSAVSYDSSSGREEEHMKVCLSGSFLSGISKQLPPELNHGENVGILQFDALSADRLFEAADRLISAGTVEAWAPAAVDQICRHVPIQACDVAGLPWTEIDFPEDLDHARERVWPAIRAQPTYTTGRVLGPNRELPMVGARSSGGRQS